MRLESGKSSYPVVGSKYASGVFYPVLSEYTRKYQGRLLVRIRVQITWPLRSLTLKKTRNKRIFKRILKRLSLKSLRLVIQRIRRIKKVFANVYVGLV